MATQSKPPAGVAPTSRCSACETEKSWEDFHRNKSTTSGSARHCKRCIANKRMQSHAGAVSDEPVELPVDLSLPEAEVLAFLVTLVKEMKPQLAELEIEKAQIAKVAETLKSELSRLDTANKTLSKELEEGKELMAIALPENKQLTDEVKALKAQVAELQQELDLKSLRLQQAEGTAPRRVTGTLAQEVVALGFQGGK